MTHPEGSLAGYVDGTLPVSERASVDAHLASCARCRDEVAVARGTRTALRSLPVEPAPADLAARALQEAGPARAPHPATGTARWYRVAGIAAAAAAILFAITLVLPHVGQRSGTAADQRAAEGAGQNAAPAALGAPEGIEIQHTNYDTASLTTLTSSYAGQTAGGAGGAATAPATVAPPTGGPQQTQRALRCIIRSAPDENGTLTRLIKARFKGAPAYLAVFLEGPGAGQPADTVTIWVFATSDCSILSFSSAKL